MFRHRKGIVRAVISGLIVAAAGITGSSVASAESTLSLNWHPCPENPAVECAQLTVPLDWSRPRGELIDIAVARRATASPEQRIGSLVLLPGGPGGSGVNTLLAKVPVSAQLAARFDIVSFDPRGTNRSHPVMCDANLLNALPNVIPDTGATLAGVQEYSRRLGESCRQHTGALIDHVDSVSTARDIDALRAALGERKISLYGASYGTLAGAMYAEQFPSRVRTLLLDSVFDHSLGVRRFLDTQARTGEDSFTEFANWCAGDSRCALHGRDVGQIFDDLYAKAVRGQLHEPGDPTTLISPMDLVSGTITYFYRPTWALAALRLQALADQPPSATALSTSELAEFPIASFCADHRIDIASESEWLALWERQNRNAPHLRMHFAWQVVALCAAWPAAVGNPQHRLNIHRTPPILIANSLHDPATGYEWATNVASQIPGSVLLTHDGWGHGVVNSRNECASRIADQYFIDLAVPPRDTHCPAVQPTTLDLEATTTTAPTPW
jgi:pimeloyl-ACP methyl ester carboxylesterase